MSIACGVVTKKGIVTRIKIEIPMKTSQARAVWTGNLKQGSGKATLPSINQEVSYSASSRFGEDKGTNPEELIAAAHAQCFSMALAGLLAEEDHQPEKITTTARVTVENVDGGYKITRSQLECEVVVPGMGEDKFNRIAEKAKSNCPVSRALSSLDISLKARLSS
jgi:lipoyl-dependent peroxiredoxin